MNSKNSRIEQAKLAKAYMKGGLPPYQAARKCGFLRVSLMEESIRELEANENLANAASVENKPDQGNDDSMYLKKAQVSFDPKPSVDEEHETRTFYKPLKNWRNEKASVSYYGPNDSLAPMYRLMLDGRAIYLNIPETSIKDVASLLCEAAGLNGAGSTDTGKTERIAELEDELAATKAELTALKLKVFDKLISMV